MNLPRRFSGLALAALTLAGAIVIPRSAKADDLVDFLWGGSAEYGGGRSIVSFDPQYKPNQIIVSFSDRRIYLITKPGEAITYPVAVPMGEARWQGVTFVSNKKVNPSWTPTPDMVRNNPRLPSWVPGGHPMNPLGIRAMYLGSSAYRIHGTDAPWTIGQAVSHGCIRMTNEDVLDLYPRVPVGMRVTVTWQRFTTHSIASNDYPSYGSSSSSNGGSSSSSSYRPTRTASNKSNSGSIGGLFFWDDQSEKPSTPAPAQVSASASESAPNSAAESSVSALTPASSDPDADLVAPSKKKSSSAAASSVSVSALTPASGNSDAEAITPPKKKSSTASVTKKKSEPTSEATPAATPATHVTTHANSIPDPVKPRDNAPADPVAPELMPAATKASASASETMPVQKAAAEAQ